MSKRYAPLIVRPALPAVWNWGVYLYVLKGHLLQPVRQRSPGLRCTRTYLLTIDKCNTSLLNIRMAIHIYICAVFSFEDSSTVAAIFMANISVLVVYIFDFLN